MKLTNKLFLYFGILFFFTINIFGMVLIQSNFNLTVKNTVNASLGEYSVIYTNLESKETMRNIFLTNRDIIKIKSDSYLKNINNPNISLEFRTLDKKMFYSTKNSDILYSEKIYNIKDNLSNYMIYKEENNKILLITNIISINNNKYYFTYMNNLDNLYNDRIKSIFTLIKLNVVIGVFLLFIIYLISIEITKPINNLIDSMEDIIEGNYNKKFTYKSNISEINSISNNFSLMNEEIQKKIKQLREQNNSKQRFIDNLTHEIRTPLTSIIGYSDLMMNKKVQDIDLIYKSFNNINREWKRILALTSNLVSLITLDKKSLKLNNYSLKEILYDVRNALNMKIIQYDVELLIKGDDIEVFSDKNLLTILISNFIDNAIKATIDRDIRKVISIVDKNILIIKDTGKGISKSDINKIFEPFYMADKSRNKSVDGFGLGLSICKEISNLLDINIEIKSEIDVGTEIILNFKGSLREWKK